MWIPDNHVGDDKHHHIFFTCSKCKGQKRACQFFGHTTEQICGSSSLRTIYDKPVCNSNNCQELDFLRPTHSLSQIFCDENLDWHRVFFANAEQAELFFINYPAQQCLDNDITWFSFLAISQFYRLLNVSGKFLSTDIVVSEEITPSGSKKLFYVSGFLPNRLGL